MLEQDLVLEQDLEQVLEQELVLQQDLKQVLEEAQGGLSQELLE